MAGTDTNKLSILYQTILHQRFRKLPAQNTPPCRPPIDITTPPTMAKPANGAPLEHRIGAAFVVHHPSPPLKAIIKNVMATIEPYCFAEFASAPHL